MYVNVNFPINAISTICHNFALVVKHKCINEAKSFEAQRPNFALNCFLLLLLPPTREK